MTREVSRRRSQAAEERDPKRTVRPDRVGYRGLDPKIVEDRPDPAPGLERGQDMDKYLGGVAPTDGKSK